MQDKEHEEWLQNRNARKAAQKKSAKPKPLSPAAGVEKKIEPEDDTSSTWRGEY